MQAAGIGSDALTGDQEDQALTGDQEDQALTAEPEAGPADITGKAPEYRTAQIGEGGDRRAGVYFYDYENGKPVKQLIWKPARSPNTGSGIIEDALAPGLPGRDAEGCDGGHGCVALRLFVSVTEKILWD